VIKKNFKKTKIEITVLKTNTLKKNEKFAFADTVKTTSGYVAIITLISFGAFFIISDTLGIRSRFFDKQINTPEKATNNKGKKVKLVYVVTSTENK